MTVDVSILYVYICKSANYTQFIYSNRDDYIAIALCSSLLHSAIAKVERSGENLRCYKSIELSVSFGR
jgi:hypothetical protein